MYIVRNKKFTIITIVVMVFIFMQSALPANLSQEESGRIVNWIVAMLQGVCPVERDTVSFIVRKCAHFTEYMVLGLCLAPAVKEWMDSEKVDLEKEFLKKALLAAWLTGTLYAVTDEVHQYFVPGRSCELRDMMIDSSGVLTGLLLGLLVTKIKRKICKSLRSN